MSRNASQPNILQLYTEEAAKVARLEVKLRNLEINLIDLEVLKRSTDITAPLYRNMTGISEFLSFNSIRHLIVMFVGTQQLPLRMKEAFYESPVGEIPHMIMQDCEISSTEPFIFQEAYYVIPVCIKSSLVGLMCFEKEFKGNKSSEAIALIVSNILASGFLLSNASLSMATTLTELMQDALMNIGNFRALKEDVASFSPLHVGMSDIDYFKRVNDSYGHEIGDTVLKKLGSILKDLTSRDVVPYRHGGDEIIILSNNADKLKEFIENVREKFCSYEFVTDTGVKFSCTLSIGVATNCPNYAKGKEWADYAMYVVKTTGKNNYKMIPCSNDTPNIEDLKVKGRD